jgi:hypothetical protein
VNARLPAEWPFTRRELLAVLLGFLLTLPFVTTRIYASDEVQYYAWLRSWAFDRDVDFENEYQHFYDAGVARNTPYHETFLERRNEAGRRENYAPIGSALLWSPFFAVGHLVTLTTNAPADGYSQPYIAAVSYGSAIYGALAVLLSAAIARRVIGRGLAASLIVCAGTPLFFYIYIAPPMSHANSAFAVALFLWVWLRVREQWSLTGVALLGISGALMTMVRDQDVFFGVGPALDLARHWVRGRRSPVAQAVVGAVAFAVAYTPQLLATSALHGHFGPSEVVARKMTWTSPHGLQVLFSPENGFFAWTPLALMAILGLLLLALRRVPLTSDASEHDAAWIGTLSLIMVAMQAYISGAVESWTVAGAFGQRRFVGLTPLLTLGVASVLQTVADPARRLEPFPLPPTANPTRIARQSAQFRDVARQRRVRTALARATASVLLAVCIWWNLGLMVQFGTHRMDRQRLTLRENAWTTFVVLPREAPTLAWRYLTDRATFYGQPRR